MFLFSPEPAQYCEKITKRNKRHHVLEKKRRPLWFTRMTTKEPGCEKIKKKITWTTCLKKTPSLIYKIDYKGARMSFHATDALFKAWNRHFDLLFHIWRKCHVYTSICEGLHRSVFLKKNNACHTLLRYFQIDKLLNCTILTIC